MFGEVHKLSEYSNFSTVVKEFDLEKISNKLKFGQNTHNDV